MSSFHSISQATPDDLELLVDLFDRYRIFYNQESDKAGAREFLKARFQANESVIFISRWEDQPAGFIQLYPFFTSVGMRKKWILNDLFVVPDFRRRGVGLRLVLEAVDFAKSTGADSISLETGRENHAAQKLYEQLGWQKDTRFFVYSYSLKPSEKKGD